jgi:hypothetical protein
VLSYTYWWQGKDILTKKLQVVLLSADEHKYCLGVMKAIKGNFEELETASNVTWKTGKVVRATKVHFINDKINYIHAPIKIVIDLRATTITGLLSAPVNFPSGASPPAPVADVVELKLQLKERRLFDVLGYASVSEIRYGMVAGGTKAIVDVEVVDGSETAAGKTATCKFTIFIPTSSTTVCPQTLTDLKSSSSKPLAFFALSAGLDDNSELKIYASNDFYWTVAQGAKTTQLLSRPELQNLEADAKESLTAMSSWEPNVRRDFLAEACPQSAVALINTYVGGNSQVAHDVVHQLNFVEVEAPQMGTNVWTHDKKRIWLAKVRINDLTGCCEVAMREKAALQLAGLDPEDEQSPKKFEEMMELGHVQFPLLCSVRINVVARVNKDSSNSQVDGQGEINKVIVEAVEQDLAASPNRAYLELLAFVNQCPHEAEGIVPARLDAIKSTSHYPLQIDFGDIIRPCSKALVLIEITERTQSEKNRR